MRATTMLVLALALPPAAAGAADIPGGPSTRAVLPLGVRFTQGVFENFTDADWYRVRLERGRTYALDARGFPSSQIRSGAIRLRLLDARGGRLLTAMPTGGYDAGFEVTPDRTGLYYVALVDIEALTYQVRVAADVPGNASTRATLPVGVPVKGHWIYRGDDNWYRTTLAAGHAYRFGLDYDPGLYASTCVRVRDAAGRLLASDETEHGLDRFVAPAAGAYFVSVKACDIADSTPDAYVLTATDLSSAGRR